MEKKKKSLRERISHMPMFWQYLLPMTVILVLAVLVQIFTSAYYTKIMADTYIQREEETFSRNRRLVQSQLQNVYSVTEVLGTSTHYKQLQSIAAGKTPATAKSLALDGLQKTFNTTLQFMSMPGAVEYFVYYPQESALFTRHKVFTDPAQCFADYMVYEAYSPKTLMAYLEEQKQTSFFPSCRIDGKDYLTAILPPLGSNCIVGLLYPESTFLELFDMDVLPEHTYLRLEDPWGKTVFSTSGGTTKNAYEMSYIIMGNRVTLGIPQDHFGDLTAPVRNLGLGALALTLLLGVALSVILSNAGARPLRKLLSSYSLGENGEETRNEIFRLADLLSASRQAEEAVGQILSFSVLARVLSGGVLTKEEESSLLDTHPVLREPCRVAMVHTAELNEDIGQTAVTELLQEHLPEQFVCVTVNNLETGVLFPDDSDALQTLAQVLQGADHLLKMDGLSIQCGVSAPFAGVHSTYAAVRQARFSIPIRESSMMEVYSARPDGDERPGVFSWLTHERLYQAVMKNDRQDTLEFIRKLGEDRYYSAAEAKEVFYNVRFVVRSTAGELLLPLPEADSLEYREECLSKENFQNLEKLADTLFDRLLAREKTAGQNSLDTVMAYLQENFRDPDLSAAAVANHFSLPVKNVYAAVRDKTDKSFNEYLTNLRMKEAARLLCASTAGVDEIGQACGYPAQSTFYRVFKKYYGESPNRYRSLNSAVNH